jgi:hypothetical protein
VGLVPIGLASYAAQFQANNSFIIIVQNDGNMKGNLKEAGCEGME